MVKPRTTTRPMGRSSVPATRRTSAIRPLKAPAASKMRAPAPWISISLDETRMLSRTRYGAVAGGNTTRPPPARAAASMAAWIPGVESETPSATAPYRVTAKSAAKPVVDDRAIATAATSERKPRTKLDVSRQTSARDRTECGVVEVGIGIRVRAMVECVEQVDTKLKPVLIPDLNVLAERQVEVPGARPTRCSTREISRTNRHAVDHRDRLVRRAHEIDQVGSDPENRFDTRDGIRTRPDRRAALDDRQGQSRLEVVNPRHHPPAGDSAHQCGCVGQPRQLVEGVPLQIVLDVGWRRPAVVPDLIEALEKPILQVTGNDVTLPIAHHLAPRVIDVEADAALE